MGGPITIAAVLVAGFVFYRVWIASLRRVEVSLASSSAYSWDVERPERFHNGRRVFDVRRAKQLISRTPREVKLVDVASIGKRYDASRVGVDPNEIGEMPIDLNFPLILVSEGEGVLIIDGWHRVAKAIQTGAASLRAVWLTEDEKRLIES